MTRVTKNIIQSSDLDFLVSVAIGTCLSDANLRVLSKVCSRRLSHFSALSVHLLQVDRKAFLLSFNPSSILAADLKVKPSENQHHRCQKTKIISKKLYSG